MPRKEPVPPTHLYSDEASWAAIGTNLAKISGPVTAGSVGFTGKGFTRGAPKSREYHRDQAHRKTQGNLLPIPSSSANPTPQFPLSCQTFYRLKGIQCWHRLMVDKVIILLGRIIPGSQEKSQITKDTQIRFPCKHCSLALFASSQRCRGTRCLIRRNHTPLVPHTYFPPMTSIVNRSASCTVSGWPCGDRGDNQG